MSWSRSVRHATEIGLVPMLMTHGQTLLQHPEFLEQLIVEGGLRQMAVHIDMTQAGRADYPINRVESETDLHPVRQAFTDRAKRMRTKTRLPFELAHNCTVTARNLDSVAEIVRWFLADPERSRIWRILSFQPQANTGRTIFSKNPVTPPIVWRELCRGIGRPLDGGAYIGGHPDCNQGVSLLIDQSTNHFLPLFPADDRTRVFTEVLDKLGALSTMTTDAEAGRGSLIAYRIAGAMARHPRLAGRIVARLGSLVATGAIPGEFLRALALGRAHTINIGTHNFMDAAEVANAPNDPAVHSRLAGCVFKGAVKNRASGEWKAVPMCAMNQSRWSELYAERVARASDRRRG